jgi:pheromone receptor transcription factor
MATDITNHDPTVSPSHDNDENGTGALGVDATRGTKRARPNPEDDDDDDEKGGKERRKIDIKFIQDKSRRHITFSKRKAGIMKKVSSSARDERSINSRPCLNRQKILIQFQAYELSVLTGTQVLLLVVSETGLVYTFTTPKLQPLVTKSEGKNLIQVRLVISHS